MSRLCILILVAFTLSACTISDEDRCPKGYDFNHSGKVCCEKGWHFDSTVDNCVAPDTDTTTEDDTDIDGGVDGGISTGIGEYCTSDENCAGYEATFCAIDPFGTEGYCTVENCDPGECPVGYQCCDCSMSTIVEGIACLNSQDALLASGAAGCSCI